MTTTAALQEALAAEHATVHLLAHLGGIVPATQQPALRDLIEARHRQHRACREFLTTTLRAAGEVPVAAEAAYALPTDTGTPREVRAHGARVEELCSRAYATLVASSSGDLRTWAMGTLTDAALAQVSWGVAPTAFPGAPELG